MKVFSFIKWWWMQLETGAKYALPCGLWILSVSLSVVAKMPYLSLALLSLVPLAGLLLLVVIVYNYWKKYNNHLDKERQDIVDRLAGKSSPRRWPGAY
jgi:hypothetical protein